MMNDDDSEAVQNENETKSKSEPQVREGYRKNEPCMSSSSFDQLVTWCALHGNVSVSLDTAKRATKTCNLFCSIPAKRVEYRCCAFY